LAGYSLTYDKKVMKLQHLKQKQRA